MKKYGTDNLKRKDSFRGYVQADMSIFREILTECTNCRKIPCM